MEECNPENINGKYNKRNVGCTFETSIAKIIKLRL